MTTSLARFVFYENDRVLVTQNDNLTDLVPKNILTRLWLCFKLLISLVICSKMPEIFHSVKLQVQG